MSKFLTPLTLTANADGRTATLHAPLRYQSDAMGMIISVPAGFITDGASVPRLFWNVIPPWGQYGGAAVMHDFLYRRQPFSRRLSDKVLLEAMWVSNCKVWQYLVIYLAVRLFGRWAWEQDAERLE